MFTDDEVSYSHEALKDDLPHLKAHLSKVEFGYLMDRLWDADITTVDRSMYEWIDRQARRSARSVVGQRGPAAGAFDGASRLMLDADWSDILMNPFSPVARLPKDAQVAWGEAFVALAGRYITRRRQKRD